MEGFSFERESGQSSFMFQQVLKLRYAAAARYFACDAPRRKSALNAPVPNPSFGDLANFNPHLHVLAADGAFLPEGRFVPLPAVPEQLLAEGFRRAVLEFLVQQQALSEGLRSRMLGWRQEGRQGPVRIIALINDPPVVRRILEHLGLWQPQATERSPPVPPRPRALRGC